MSSSFMGVIGVVFIVWLFVFAVLIREISPWIKALANGISIGLVSMLGMRLRGVPPSLIIDSMILAKKGEIEVSPEALESHFLAGGNVNRVVAAMVASQRTDVGLSFQQATAIDLAGGDPLEIVKRCANGEELETLWQKILK